MNTKQAPQYISVPAGSDLSTKEKHFMTITAGALATASAGVRVAGVLDDKPAAGRRGRLQIGGVALVIAGSSGSAGSVASDANGKAVPATATDNIAGFAMHDYAQNDEVEVLLTPAASLTIGGYLDTVLDDGALDDANTYSVIFVSVSGTVAADLPDGLYVGQEIRIHCDVADTTPDGTVSGKFLTHAGAAATALVLDAAGEWGHFVWTGAAWRVLQLSGATIS